MNMANKHTLKIGGVIVVALVLIVAAYFFVFVRQSGEYSIVYLTTGEVYVGHLSTFPRLMLTDGYIFQAIPDPTDPKKSTFQLNPLKDALWAPQYLYFNSDHILFSGPLSESSNILKTLRNPSSNSATISPRDNPSPTTSTQPEKNPK